MSSRTMRLPWKRSLRRFFDDRAERVTSVPTLQDLCFISGRDPRLWMDQSLLDELFDHIATMIGISQKSRVLEVGCAAGFVARGIAPRVASYVGVDLAAEAIKVARRLGLKNAEYVVSDASGLKLPDNSFDAAYCYDVFTNLPEFEHGVQLISEMLRVTRPGGKVLIGSIPDADCQEAFERHFPVVAQDLERRYGPLHQTEPSEAASKRPWWKLFRRAEAIKPEIVCYYFKKSDFRKLAEELGVDLELVDIHPSNPYVGFRFNAIYIKR